jgi:hypothetical protein
MNPWRQVAVIIKRWKCHVKLIKRERQWLPYHWLSIRVQLSALNCRLFSLISGDEFAYSSKPLTQTKLESAVTFVSEAVVGSNDANG